MRMMTENDGREMVMVVAERCEGGNGEMDLRPPGGGEKKRWWV